MAPFVPWTRGWHVNCAANRSLFVGEHECDTRLIPVVDRTQNSLKPVIKLSIVFPGRGATTGERGTYTMTSKIAYAIALLVASTTWANAYLDPGTGSLVLQILIAGALTAVASVRMFWDRLKEIARRVIGLKSTPADRS